MSFKTGSTAIPVFFLVGLPLLQSNSSIPWWVWVILIIVLFILLYLLLRGGKKDLATSERAMVVEPEPAPQEPVSVVPDDLTVIEGIGPKINQFLHDSGILTFQHLADADVEHLDQMLDAANLRLADPTTWNEQARLAAAGDWETLQKLQDELKGGRIQ